MVRVVYTFSVESKEWNNTTLFLKSVLVKKMPINVFGSTSVNKENILITSSFVQKPYQRTNYVQRIFKEDINKKNQYKNTNLPNSFSIREAGSKSYVAKNFNDTSIF